MLDQHEYTVYLRGMSPSLEGEEIKLTGIRVLTTKTPTEVLDSFVTDGYCIFTRVFGDEVFCVFRGGLAAIEMEGI
jgi:hypothetical protein